MTEGQSLVEPLYQGGRGFSAPSAGAEVYYRASSRRYSDSVERVGNADDESREKGGLEGSEGVGGSSGEVEERFCYRFWKLNVCKWAESCCWTLPSRTVLTSSQLPEGVEKLKMAGSPIDPTKIFAAYGSGGPSDRYYLTQPETLKVVRTGKRRAGLGSSVKVVEDWLDVQNNGEGTRKA